jgi:hypothetical protein
MVEACYKNCSCPDLINSSVKIGIGERERKKRREEKEEEEEEKRRKDRRKEWVERKMRRERS